MTAADGARRLRATHARGERAVGVELSVGNAGELGEHGLVEGRDAQVERKLEVAAAAGEVLVELTADLVERDPEHARPEAARQRLLLALDLVGDPAESAWGSRDEELADR